MATATASPPTATPADQPADVIRRHLKRLLPCKLTDEEELEIARDAAKKRRMLKQLAALDAAGVPATKLPRSFSMADASRLLARFAHRRNSDPRLCSLAQAKAIAKAGIRGTATMTFNRARELCEKLRLAGWSRPMVVWGEPEASTPESLAAIAEIRRHMADKRAAARATSAADMADHEAIP